jgi:hypothetical protein
VTAAISVATTPVTRSERSGRRLGVTTQAVALLATKLQARGLIERRTHPRHRNVQELHLTAAGGDALERAEAVILRLERQMHEILGPDGYDQLRILLDDVVSGLAGWVDDAVDPPVGRRSSNEARVSSSAARLYESHRSRRL